MKKLFVDPWDHVHQMNRRDEANWRSGRLLSLSPTAFVSLVYAHRSALSCPEKLCNGWGEGMWPLVGGHR